MTFDIDRFTRQIAAMTEEVYQMRKLCGLKGRSKRLASLCLTGLDVDPDYFDHNHFYLEGYPDYDEISAHGKLAVLAGEGRLKANAAEIIEDLITAAPVLGAQDIRIHLCIGSRSRAGAQIKMSLLDISLNDKGTMHTAEDIGLRLKRLTNRLKGISSGLRTFRFNDNYDIFANAPEDAYRIFAAIHQPGLFEPGNTTARMPNAMVEVFDPRLYQAALA